MPRRTCSSSSGWPAHSSSGDTTRPCLFRVRQRSTRMLTNCCGCMVTIESIAVIDSSIVKQNLSTGYTIVMRRQQAFELQGHRGARGLKPESTLPSFEAAIDAGASSVETDVHLSADGVPVLFHDASLSERLCRVASGQQ